MAQETIEQLQEFEASLEKSLSGNISLVDQIGQVRQAIESAIRSGKTTSAPSLFVQKEINSLRSRLASLDSERKFGKISFDSYASQAVEILQLLVKSNEPLSPAEQDLLRQVLYHQLSSLIMSTLKQ